jgi:hypothetical protein
MIEGDFINCLFIFCGVLCPYYLLNTKGRLLLRMGVFSLVFVGIMPGSNDDPIELLLLLLLLILLLPKLRLLTADGLPTTFFKLANVYMP